MSLKDEYIRQTENHINNLVEKKALLTRDLADLEASETEAREMLQFFKTGNGSSTKSKLSRSEINTKDFYDILKMVGAEKAHFTAADVVAVTDEPQKNISSRLRGIVRDNGNSGIIVRTKDGGPGIPAVYKLNPNYKE